MKILSIVLAIVIASATFAFAQETNSPRNGPVSYMERVAHGFGQLKEPRWAGDKPAWMIQQEADQRVQRMELTINHRSQGPRGPMMNRGPWGRGSMAMDRGEFQRGSRGPMIHQRGMQFQKEMQTCPQCKKHMKHMKQKHFKGGKKQ